MKSLLMLFLVSAQLIVFCAVKLSQAGTWREDFEDRMEDEWQISNPNRRVEKWWVDDGEAVGEIFQPGFMSVWLTGNLNWQNYSVSCRSKLVEEKEEPGTVGLTLHNREGGGSRYLFILAPTLGIVRIIRVAPEGLFIFTFPFVTELNRWYQLKASISEEIMQFRIDDKVFLGRDLNPLAGGKAGLLVSNAQARFDDIEISGSNIKNGGPGRARSITKRRILTKVWANLRKH